MGSREVLALLEGWGGEGRRLKARWVRWRSAPELGGLDTTLVRVTLSGGEGRGKGMGRGGMS